MTHSESRAEIATKDHDAIRRQVLANRKGLERLANDRKVRAALLANAPVQVLPAFLSL